MYASKLMELVRENPEKYEGRKYKVVSGSKLYLPDYYNTKRTGECIIMNGNIMCENIESQVHFHAAVLSDTRLEEIKQPVSFFEAISDPHNKIKCDMPYSGLCDYDWVCYVLHYIAKSIAEGKEKHFYKDLINAKWYIKDDDNE